MMKKLLFLLALGAATPVWAQDVAPPAPLAVAAPENAPFAWRLNLRVGQKWLTTTDTSTQMSQQMPVMPGAPETDEPVAIENTSTSHTSVEQSVLSVDEKGARIEMIYRESSSSSLIRQGEVVIYDTANPPAGVKAIPDVAQNFVGARISFLLSPSGEFSDFKGIEGFLDRMGAGVETGLAKMQDAATQKTMRKMMASFLSPEMIKNSLGAAYLIMPTTPVALGETWKHTTVTPMMGTSMSENGQGTFASRAEGKITIAQKSDFATDAGADMKIPLPEVGAHKAMPVTQMDLHGVSSGEIVVDEKSGLTLESRSTQNLEGEMVMSGLTGPGSVMKLPMSMKSETLVKSHEIKTTP